MGAVCVRRDSEQSEIVREKNRMILETIKEETQRLQGFHQWAKDLFRKYKSLDAKNLYKEGYQQTMQSFLRYTPSIVQQIPPSKHTILSDQLIKNSCIIAQDQLNNTADRTNDQLIVPKQQFPLDESFNQQANRNPSMMMQMSVIYKSEFSELKKFNDSRKRFFKWEQIAEGQLEEGFLLPLYRVFAHDLKHEIEGKMKEKTDVFLGGIVESTNNFINMMIVLYTRVYSLEVINKQDSGQMFRHDNIFNFAITNLFKRTNIGSLLQQALKQKLLPQIQLLTQKMKLLRDRPPSYFQISPQFIPSHLSWINSEVQSHPRIYQPVIQYMVDVSKDPIPIGKVKCINLASRKMVTELNEFYERNGQEAPNLDPDNVTSIMMYAIVQSNNPELIVDVTIAENFSSRNCLNCVSGYYMNIMKACFEMIEQAK